jgi:vancomycin resistance protein VanW
MMEPEGGAFRHTAGKVEMPAMNVSVAAYGFRSIRRSAARKLAGKFFYRFRRYAQWYLSGHGYAHNRLSSSLPVVCATHSTPLIRNLLSADMWLQRNKVTNLRLAAQRLNGVVIRPGETFSFWKIVGNPTKRKGYLPGMVLDSGKMKAGTGGGLCQVTNMIYWMALHTPLTVTERYRHSYDLFPDADRTQPFGSGATCSYSSLDLQIRNDTDKPYQLSLSIADGYLEGSLRSTAGSALHYEIYEREHGIFSCAWGGYIRHNALWRKVLDGGGLLVSDEFIAENNALMMYQPYLAEGERPQSAAFPV